MAHAAPTAGSAGPANRGTPRSRPTGTRALDVSRPLPGPFATAPPTDPGTDVIKVEDARPGGDPARATGRRRLAPHDAATAWAAPAAPLPPRGASPVDGPAVTGDDGVLTTAGGRLPSPATPAGTFPALDTDAFDDRADRPDPTGN
ncbi:hypothetical protein GCM10009678_19170 [Actinomadura kijaniata]|uniref:Uncharacterized protein n=1 Tax=Actinomadura namibiensis TaxID=182080 RepID=A0A7W3LXK1_ACTNM|nr:CoA transferase [Actinomadura namibiensis]MBA8956163.1 hypothetical protein [Actinomadura namibiensis]